MQKLSTPAYRTTIASRGKNEVCRRGDWLPGCRAELPLTRAINFHCPRERRTTARTTSPYNGLHGHRHQNARRATHLSPGHLPHLDAALIRYSHLVVLTLTLTLHRDHNPNSERRTCPRQTSPAASCTLGATWPATGHFPDICPHRIRVLKLHVYGKGFKYRELWLGLTFGARVAVRVLSY